MAPRCRLTLELSYTLSLYGLTVRGNEKTNYWFLLVFDLLFSGTVKIFLLFSLSGSARQLPFLLLFLSSVIQLELVKGSASQSQQKQQLISLNTRQLINK